MPESTKSRAIVSAAAKFIERESTGGILALLAAIAQHFNLNK